MRNYEHGFRFLCYMTFTYIFQLTQAEDVKVFEFSQNKSLSITGKRLVGHVIEEFSTKRQISHCAYECLKVSRCRSFNYEHESHVCQINDADHLTEIDSLVDDHGIVYSERNAFSIDKEALGLCALEPCQNGGRCLETVDSKMTRTYFCLCFDDWMGDNCTVQKNRINWGEWSDWGPCSVSCEIGWTTRHRPCIDTVNGDTMTSSQCFGHDVEYQSCTLQSCPQWDTWSGWGSCSTENTCGRGVTRRHRNCTNGGVPGKDRFCLGYSEETGPCYGINCRGMLVVEDSEQFGDGRIQILNDLDDVTMPICADDNWGTSEIDIACKQIGFEGAATEGVFKSHNRTYQTNKTVVYRVTCKGNESTLQACTREPIDGCSKLAGIQCRVRGGWSLWSEWGDCSVTCENGTRTRTRDCNHPPPNYGGTPCPGEETQYKHCQLPMCPINGVWDPWTSWGQCNVSCGGGTQSRGRMCIQPEHGGNECTGESEQWRDCNMEPCPVDGYWDPWTSWENCNVSCGGGTQSRDRMCIQPEHGGENCTGNTIQWQDCNTGPCPVDGFWDSWTSWGQCNVSCGGGTQSRDRMCNQPEHGGENCTGQAEQLQECNTEECPIDGLWNPWQSWGKCNVSCGGGTQSRDRICNQPEHGGENCTGASEQWQTCNEDPCPVDGFWDPWTTWGQCNVSCGGGTQSRDRMCNQPEHGGENCTGDTRQWQDCNTEPCPTDGTFGDWGVWSSCAVTCGNGTMYRNRTCYDPLYGGKNCSGDFEEERVCAMENCPVDGVYEEWQSWIKCTKTCGNGTRRRERTCFGPYFGGNNCTGPAEEEETCAENNCPVDGVWEEWSNWTECSHSCESDGIQYRNRTCTGPFYGGENCTGEEDEMRSCNPDPCPIDGMFGEWEPWSECTASCGNGTKWRERVCYGPYFGCNNCTGPTEDSANCAINFCPVDGVWEVWSNWTECSHSCGLDDIQYRNRTCTGRFYGGENCTGEEDEINVCTVDPCLIPGLWSEWTAWSLCTVTCGGGTRRRERTCDMEAFGNLTTDCEGDAVEELACHTFHCTPLAVHCADWARKGLSQSCTADVDPDGDGIDFGPLQVQCDFDSMPRKAVTVLHHDKEDPIPVTGFDLAGQFKIKPTYDAGFEEATRIVNNSANCQQFIRWDCLSAIIHNTLTGEVYTYWNNRDLQQQDYFGRSCGRGYACECDKNDAVWRFDEGNITTKTDLPVHSFHCGDTGAADEEGIATLGPLLCWGNNLA